MLQKLNRLYVLSKKVKQSVGIYFLYGFSISYNPFVANASLGILNKIVLITSDSISILFMATDFTSPLTQDPSDHAASHAAFLKLKESKDYSTKQQTSFL